MTFIQRAIHVEVVSYVYNFSLYTENSYIVYMTFIQGEIHVEMSLYISYGGLTQL